MFDIITIGDCTWDDFFDIENARLSPSKNSHRFKELCIPYGQKIRILSTHASVGGNAANVAVGMSRMKFETTIISAIANDERGIRIHEALQKEKVCTDYLFISNKKNHSSRYSIVLNFKKERTILSSSSNIPFPEIPLPTSRAAYLTSMGKKETSFYTKQILAKKQKEKSFLFAMNPGMGQIKNNLEDLKELLSETDILFLNKEEAQIFLNKKTSIQNLLSLFLKKGVHTVVITDGTKGSFAGTQNERGDYGLFDTPAISKTGAGDAFATGFLTAVLQKQPLQTCLIFGTANAASVVQHLGAETGLLTKEGLRSFLKKHT